MSDNPKQRLEYEAEIVLPANLFLEGGQKQQTWRAVRLVFGLLTFVVSGHKNDGHADE